MYQIFGFSDAINGNIRGKYEEFIYRRYQNTCSTLSVPSSFTTHLYRGGLGGPPRHYMRNHNLKSEISEKSSCAQKSYNNIIIKVTEHQSHELILLKCANISTRRASETPQDRMMGGCSVFCGKSPQQCSSGKLIFLENLFQFYFSQCAALLTSKPCQILHKSIFLNQASLLWKLQSTYRPLLRHVLPGDHKQSLITFSSTPKYLQLFQIFQKKAILLSCLFTLVKLKKIFATFLTSSPYQNYKQHSYIFHDASIMPESHYIHSLSLVLFAWCSNLLKNKFRLIF